MIPPVTMPEAAASPEPACVRLLVLAPTYNNATTLPELLRGLEALGWPILVINDGSLDATAAILGAWADPARDRHVLTHDLNRGKAAALQSGFTQAQHLGFTHAATIDTDGQHDPRDLLPLAAAARATPEAMVVGVRPIETDNYPARSRIGRRVSNLLVRLLGGVRVADSQCGLRIYPLATLLQLGTRAGRYAFETEVLIRAGWANVEVVQRPIRCIYFSGETRISHFKPWRDSLSATWMHMKLIARTLAPWPVRKLRPVGPGAMTGTAAERVLRWMNPLPTLRSARRDGAAREVFARSLGTGLFFAFLPPLGFKTIACLALARAARLQPTIVLAGSSLQTPPVGLLLAFIALNLGHLLLSGSFVQAGEFQVTAGGVPSLIGFALACWSVGGVLSGALAGAATYFIARGFSPGTSPATPDTLLPQDMC